MHLLLSTVNAVYSVYYITIILLIRSFIDFYALKEIPGVQFRLINVTLRIFNRILFFLDSTRLQNSYDLLQ